MIRMENVTKYYTTSRGRHYIFRDVTFEFPDGVNIAILGRSGAGKTTLLRLLAEAEVPNEGRIIRKGRICWPLGVSPRIKTSLTGLQNVRFTYRLHGLSPDEIDKSVVQVEEFADIGKYFRLPVSAYSRGMHDRLKLAICLGGTFDTYLIDELASAGNGFLNRSFSGAVRENRIRGNFIMCTQNPRELFKDCDVGVLVEQGTLIYFDKIEDAVRAYVRIVAPLDADKFSRILVKADRKQQRNGRGRADDETETANETRRKRRQPKAVETAHDASVAVAPLEPPVSGGDDDPLVARSQRRIERRRAREAGRDPSHSRNEQANERIQSEPAERPLIPHVPAPMAPRLRKGGETSASGQ